jgi:uncharacterized membrane protein
MAIDPTSASTLAAVAGMALITYATRAGGLWLMGLVPVSARVESFLRHMASSVIVAIVAATAWRGDVAMRAAIVVSVAVMAATRSTTAALAAGVGAAAAWRATLGG